MSSHTFTGLQYNGGTTANPSSVDAGGINRTNKAQFESFFWLKKAIIQARKEQYFSPLASTVGMPKHFGKEIKVFDYVPLLDEQNTNSQGIDANGVVLSPTTWKAFDSAGVEITTGTGYSASAGGFASEADAVAAAGSVTPAGSVKRNYGNLYGSSKDAGTITGKLPVLSETGGRVNRVGFTRLERSGVLHKFGFFYEWTKESLDFDSDADLNEHLSRELMNGAVQITEACLQKDLLNAAGVVTYGGAAAADDEVTGEGVLPGTDLGDLEEGEEAPPGVRSLVTYEDLMRMSITLTDNRTPKQTKIITGSRLVDTKTIPAGRVMFIGSELVPVIKAMKDLHNNQAFIPVHMYADAGTVMNGEIGTVDEFRIVVVPEMLHWSTGAAVGTVGANGYRTSGSGENERYNVYPMLVVGDDSFTTIGFQTDGKSAKFSVITRVPGSETADRNDPYGETGFSSLKWYYGILVKRPERIGLLKTIAPV
jgi:N4-gp56 family major capsid protein